MGDTVITTTSSSATLVSKIDAGDPLFLHPSDCANLTIVNMKLKGTENYSVWANSMNLALQVKNKIGFIDGTCRRSTTDEVLGRQWDTCNSIVLTWILNSVSEDLYLGHVYSKLASDVWKYLKETYDKVDGSVVFNLYQKINSFTQSGMPVSEYYHKLNCMWKQMDQLLALPACTCDASKQFNDFNHLIKLMQFLMGLDSTYQSVRTNLLTREILSSVKDAFSIISREESHLNSKKNSDKTHNSVVGFATKTNQFIDTKKKGIRTPNPNLKCSHCNKTGHTIEKCFELVGYPSWMKSKPGGNKGSRVSNNYVVENSDTTSSAVSSLTSDQIAQLLSLLHDKPKNDPSCSNFAGRCNSVYFDSNVDVFFSKPTSDFKPAYCFSNFINAGKKVGWIIDSGANQHMV
ncbi:putative transcription factor interactor and regulator CCHC(Zn) family [Helianthus anomalus]